MLESTDSDCPEAEVATAAPSWRHRVFMDEGRAQVLAFEGEAGVCPVAADGVSFVCELAWLDASADHASGGLDAVVTVDVDLAARWVASGELSGSTSQAVRCEGADCSTTAAVSPSPCTTTWSWRGTLP